MPSLAVANLRNVAIGPAIVEYLQKIDATLAPFDGRFLVHGDPIKLLEGQFHGDLVIIAFPDRANAEGWYASEAYQAILPLRTGNAEGDTFLVDTVDEGHKATDILERLSAR